MVSFYFYNFIENNKFSIYQLLGHLDYKNSYL